MGNVLIALGFFFGGLILGVVGGSVLMCSMITAVNKEYKEKTGNDFVAFINEEADELRTKHDEK